MRRSDRAVTDIQGILERCQVCHFGLDGYVVPMSYGYVLGEKLTIYAHCALEGRKIDIIRRNPRASFAIDRQVELIMGGIGCGCTAKYESVMGIGNMRIVEGDERMVGLDAIMRHYGFEGEIKYDAMVLNKTCVIALDVIEWSGKSNVTQ